MGLNTYSGLPRSLFSESFNLITTHMLSKGIHAPLSPSNGPVHSGRPYSDAFQKNLSSDDLPASRCFHQAHQCSANLQAVKMRQTPSEVLFMWQ